MFSILRDAQLVLRGATRHLVFAAMALFLACCLIIPLSDAEELKPGQRVKSLEHDGQVHHASSEEGVKAKFPDLVVRDQEGRKVRLYSDLIKDKVVVLSFFYTSCTYICSMQGRVFSELQSLLGERLGKSVFLISVTTDPVKDSPQRLKAWGERYKVSPGWTLVTGEETEMNKLLIQFTGNKAGGGMHTPATFIVNARKGLWTRAVGVFAPEHLLKAVNSVSQDDTGRSKWFVTPKELPGD